MRPRRRSSRVHRPRVRDHRRGRRSRDRNVRRMNAARCRSQHLPPQPQRPRRRRSQASERRHRTPICPSRAAPRDRSHAAAASVPSWTARAFRARKSSVSTADSVVSSATAISAYESSCHSRRNNTSRCRSGRRASASTISAESSGAASSAPTISARTLGSSANSTRARRRTRVDPRQAHVARDRQEPRRLGDRLDAAPERAVRLEEGLLQRVLGVGGPPQAAQAVPEHAGAVPAVEQLGCGCRSERAIDMFDGGHGLVPPGF